MITIPDIAIAQFWPLLIEGDYVALANLFSNDPLVDDPRVGRVEGEEAFAAYVAASSRWLERHHARVEAGATIVTAFHAASEATLYLHNGSTPIALPILIVADRTMIGGLAYLRVYHSMWQLHHRHIIRPTLLPSWPTRQLLPLVANYRAALAAGDVSQLVRLFEATAYVREPGGVAWTHRGPQELHRFYSNLLANGGIDLQTCMVIDDGVCCVLEYNVLRWGRRQLQSQPGAMVVEGAEADLIRAIRIYDDIDLPAGDLLAESDR